MQKLLNALSSADDDYLIALSNKGTLKRAYKDLENAEISAEYADNSIIVTVSGEACTIVNPIGESKCSCPSRSVCRHLITAVLWLKKNSINENPKSDDNNESGEDSQQNNFLEDKKEPDKNFVEELSAYPIKALQKAMKKQYYNSFMEKIQKGNFPEIEESSIILVRFPDENISVRLISPLEYSTCTCHSKELCRHKAAAILAWQIKNDKVKLENIKIKEANSVKINVSDVHATAEFARNFLSKLLFDGLVRASENLSEETESAAVMCHNSRLADCEKNMREIGNRLKGYISHSPEFNADLLFSFIIENIILLNNILSTDDEALLNSYLGEFKNTYITADTIEILPIAQRHFSSAAGYEGEIFYFLNTDSTAPKRFLTYSAVRPTFYEKTPRTSSLAAPWGLYGGINEILKSELRLKNPKLSGCKLSSSNDTKAEIIAPVNLNQKVFFDSIYTSFEKMITDIFSRNIYSKNSNEQLVLIAPMRCISSESDEITQSHSIVVEDKDGGALTIKMRYRSDIKEFFSRLSYIGNMMLNHPEKKFVIFGNTYIEDGRCYIYPIAIFDNIDYIDTKSENNKVKTDLNTSYYHFFLNFFGDIKRLFCDMIQCGINSYDMYEQIKEYSAESGKMGMLMFSQKLDELYSLLIAKNHTYSNDNSKIIALLAEIFNYISIGIKHMEFNMAIDNLRSEVK